MANANTPYGLRPVRHMNGGVIQTNVYPIASGCSASIFTGDPVEGVNDGSIQQAAATNVDNLGVFAGCTYTDSAGVFHWSPYWPGGTVSADAKAYVYDDPNIVFAIQSDATGVALADVHMCADWEVVAGDTKLGVSKSNLDVSAGLLGTDRSLRILRIINDGDNAPGAYADVEVIFVEHVMKGVVAGVGGV